MVFKNQQQFWIEVSIGSEQDIRLNNLFYDNEPSSPTEFSAYGYAGRFRVVGEVTDFIWFPPSASRRYNLRSVQEPPAWAVEQRR